MSPFRSKAQMNKFAEMVKEGKMSQKEFDKWAADTPHPDKLPERVTTPPGPIRTLEELKNVAKGRVIK